MPRDSKPVKLSKLAEDAYMIGDLKLGKRRHGFTIVKFEILDPHSDLQTRYEMREGYVTDDDLCAIHFERSMSRWSVTLLGSGLTIAHCKTRQGATTLVGLVYVDPFLFQASKIVDPVAAQRFPNTYSDTEFRRQIVQQAHARTKCCEDNRLDELV